VFRYPFTQVNFLSFLSIKQVPSLTPYTGCAKSGYLIHSDSSVDKNVLNASRGSVNHEAFQRVAVEVLKAQNLGAIQPLKKFLTALPSPSYVKNALLQAIYHLAEQDPETCRWILQHHTHLEPELNLIEIAQQIAIEQLQNQELALNQDFQFVSNGQLEVNESIRARLLEEVTTGDRLLLEEILFKDEMQKL